MLIYEGLPNPFGEDKLFEAEKKSKPCEQIDCQWVYARPQTPSFETAGRRQQILGTQTLVPYRGAKLCGGFHADFSVAWIKGNVTTCALFCFGCHEARIMRTYLPLTSDLNSREFRLTTDISAEGYAELRKLLSAYRKERPLPPPH